MGMAEMTQALDVITEHYAGWMQQTGVTQMDIQIDALGGRVRFVTRAFKDGVWYNNAVPALLVSEAIGLRNATVVPGGGSWTRASVFMSAPEYGIGTEFDYDVEPVLDPPYTPQDCADELMFFPRKPETIPAWMHA